MPLSPRLSLSAGRRCPQRRSRYEKHPDLHFTSQSISSPFHSLSAQFHSNVPQSSFFSPTLSSPTRLWLMRTKGVTPMSSLPTSTEWLAFQRMSSSEPRPSFKFPMYTLMVTLVKKTRQTDRALPNSIPSLRQGSPRCSTPCCQRPQAHFGESLLIFAAPISTQSQQSLTGREEGAFSWPSFSLRYGVVHEVSTVRQGCHT